MPTPTDASIACRPIPNAKPRAYGDAVLHERQRDRRLDEADVPGPEREDRRDVHQHEHEPGGGERLVDVERAHRRPDRDELEHPAEVLEGRRRQRPATGARITPSPTRAALEQHAHRAELVERRAGGAAR